MLVATGDAKTDVAVSTSANSNVAQVDCCGASDASVLISGNGEKSVNDAKLNLYNTTTVDQSNKANVRNDVDAKANSGYNDANGNTGGDVIVATGNATSLVDVATAANANWAKVGGSRSDGGHISAMIVGNGKNTDNDIDLVLGNRTDLDQSNHAYVYNDVDAKANSGKNDANGNTGGDVLIDTGNAKVDVAVDNMVNFNAADVDCGCLLDVLAKVAGNGEDSHNDITATLSSTLDVNQDNCGSGYEYPHEVSIYDIFSRYRHSKCAVDNDVNAKADSGKNDADANTGGPEGGDPAVLTGDASSFVDVSNSGNSNAYGVEPEFEWPAFDFGFNLSLDLNWSDLLALLGH